MVEIRSISSSHLSGLSFGARQIACAMKLSDIYAILGGTSGAARPLYESVSQQWERLRHEYLTLAQPSGFWC